MALKVISSFSAGELDPALRERTTLQKFETGLAAARGIYVKKTGGAITAPGTRHVAPTKIDNSKVKLHDLSKAEGDYFIELGHNYARLWSRRFAGNGIAFGTPSVPLAEIATTYTQDEVMKVQLEESNVIKGTPSMGVTPRHIVLYIFLRGREPEGIKIGVDGNTAFSMLTANQIFELQPAPLILTAATVGGLGYFIEYAVTLVRNGQESQPLYNPNGGVDYQMPIAVAQSNSMTIRLLSTADDALFPVTEMRIYRRPMEGQAYGFIGFSTNISTSGGYRVCTFKDYGQAADFTHTPPSGNPSLKDAGTLNPKVFKPRTGLVYQQRLLIDNDDSVEASRVGFPNNFTRDYPYNAESSLSLRSASSGKTEIFRMLDAEALILFTNQGVFTQTGVMGPSNLAFTRRGPWVIDEKVNPILIPGAVLFVDRSSNTVRQLVATQEGTSYLGPEVTIFSDHLFVGKQITSWAFTDNGTPLLWVTFNDGTFCTFTYEREQEMRAWTRHDYSTDVFVEQVIGPKFSHQTSPYEWDDISTPIFLVRKGTKRYIEIGVPRSTPLFALSTESDKDETAARMYSMVSKGRQFPINSITPVVADDWEGNLTIVSTPLDPFEDPGIGEVGTIYRWFHPVTRQEYDLEVVSRTDDSEVVVAPSKEFPAEYATNQFLYVTYDTVSGLDHLEGEYVSIMSDGYVLASPNNDIENYPLVQVVGGEITLPDDRRGAFIHVGRPFTADIETLNIATIEQKPSLIESQTVNKLYVMAMNQRGVYIGENFPENDKVEGMQSISVIDTEPMTDGLILGDRYPQPASKRYEVLLPGDWQSNGRVCMRIVDPVHAEILSIIPDAEVLFRR